MTDAQHNAELLSRVALRDRGAFRELYENTSSHLLGGLMRICRDRPLAEEALQEAYIQIWNKAGEFNPERAMASTWMSSIARDLALDMIRYRRREVPLADQADNIPALSAELTADPRLEAELGRCLSELEQEQREAVVMAYVEGYTHSELSERLATPLGTVKSWVRRGLLALKQCLGGAAA